MEAKQRKAYSFLLGLYLGDGSIYKLKDKNSYCLTYALDMRHISFCV